MNPDDRPTPKKKKNFYISYIKGLALIFIVLIHVVNWSNMPAPFGVFLVKEVFHTGLFLFVLTAGSVVYIAYRNKSIRQATERLWFRGLQLLLFYYLYNIIKMMVFNFSTEPFYNQFDGMLSASNIFLFKVYTVPISVLVLYVFLLLISPLLLCVNKRVVYPKSVVSLLIVGIFFVDYFTIIPSLHTPVLDFLYANNNILFSLALWIIPFLLGFYLAQVGFERQRKPMFILSSLLMVVFAVSTIIEKKSVFPSTYEFSLGPYYIVYGLFGLSIFLFMFHWCERRDTPRMRKLLSAIRLLGDNTLRLYLIHWIVIDCTIWLFPSLTGLVWLTVPVLFYAFFIIRKKKWHEYCLNQEDSVRELIAEIT